MGTVAQVAVTEAVAEAVAKAPKYGKSDLTPTGYKSVYGSDKAWMTSACADVRSRRDTGLDWGTADLAFSLRESGDQEWSLGACELLGVAEQTVRNLASLGRFPYAERVAGLSLQHHMEVQAKDAELRSALLKRAADERLSIHAFRGVVAEAVTAKAEEAAEAAKAAFLATAAAEGKRVTAAVKQAAEQAGEKAAEKVVGRSKPSASGPRPVTVAGSSKLAGNGTFTVTFAKGTTVSISAVCNNDSRLMQKFVLDAVNTALAEAAKAAAASKASK
jgi:hypothetical protein